MGPVAPAFMNLHAKCPIFSANDDEDAVSHLLCNNGQINSQGITENVNCCRFCLSPGGDAQLWYESKIPIGNDRKNLKRHIFAESSLKWKKQKKKCFKDGDFFNMIMQLTQLVLML